MKNFCLTICIVAFCFAVAAAEPDLEKDAPLVAGETFDVVWEPVFQGHALIYEAGRSHAYSVILIHGLGDNGMRDFEDLIPLLAEHYHVVAFDLPGFAHSSKHNASYSPVLYASFVKWVADRYAHTRFAVLGHSLGGAIALRFAATFPRGLDRLILVDSAGILHEIALSKFMLETKVASFVPAIPGGRHANLLRFLTEKTIDITEKLPIDLDLAVGSNTTRAKILRGNPGAIASLALTQENYTLLIEQVEIPTLIIWGANDQTTPLRTGKVLAARMPNAHLEIIKDAGHVPMRDQRDTFNRRILKELAGPPYSKAGNSPPEPRQPEDRIGRCSGESDIAFVGAYDHIEIKSCKRVRLFNVTAHSLEIVDSDVEMEGSRIEGVEAGLRIQSSFLTATSCDFSGQVAVEASRSRLDFAGVKLVGHDAAVISPDSSTLLASVTTVSSPHSGPTLHDRYVVTPENPL